MLNSQYRILLVEDDLQIVSSLCEFLKSEGFYVMSESGQKGALERIEREAPSLILLDVSLSDGNGFAVCSAVKAKYDIPIIFLTASGDEFSTVAGFDLGADDYIAKPFRPRELLSRIKNILSRYNKSSAIVKITDSISVDTARAFVTKDGCELFLSALEYRLLLIFVNNRGCVLTREKLLEEIWDAAGEFVGDNTLNVYIKRLRDKIEPDPQNPTVIKTVRGMGYKMK